MIDVEEIKSRNPVLEVAERYTSLRAYGKRYAGPCPICGGRKQTGRFEVWPAEGRWVCAVCQDGGDVLELVMKVERVDFRAAVERLGGGRVESDESRKRRAEMREALEAERAKEAAAYREGERRRTRELWEAAGPIGEGGPISAYLAGRALRVPLGAFLREALDVPYFGPKPLDGPPRELWRGPAMLAAIAGVDGRFAGLHTTWVDPAAPGSKASIVDPETGEVLPAKKVRGSKKGGRIELVRQLEPGRLFIGEGIETVLSVWCGLVDLRHALLEGAAFWSSVDLGNLGGPADGAIAHPSAVSPKGRPLRVPSPMPADGPAIQVPESVTEIVVLGDGDSDPFLTEKTIERAARRWARPGRTIRRAMASAGFDFNDIRRGKA